jgi:parvulin-like peptidyl-prolyl isomerase
MKPIRPSPGALLAAALLLPGAAVALAADPPASPPPAEVMTASTVERIVAVVNSEIILLSELKERAQQNGQPIDDSGTVEARRKAELSLRPLLDKLVDDALVLQQAAELKLAVEPAEVDRAIEEVKRQNHIDGEQFEQALAEQGFTMGAYRADLKKQILRLKVINTAVRSRVNIGDEEVKAYYEQTARQSGGHRQAHVRHILISVPAGTSSAAIDEKRRTAVKILEEARGGGDFAKLAARYSDDTLTRGDGGDLGWLKEGEGLPEAMNEVVFTMEQANEVRGPLRTDRGFELVQLIDRKEGDMRPYAEVKDQLRQKLQGEQLEKQTTSWLAELRKKAHLEIRL